MSHSIRLKTTWTGKIDGKEKRVEAGEIVNVDLVTMKALCFQHQIAEPVSVEEMAKIIADKEKKPPPKNKGKPKASKTKAQVGPAKDKMVKGSTTK